MCWNQEISLNTFVFGTFVLLLIIYNNAYTKYKIFDPNIWFYLFIFSVIFMQLVEFFIWRNVENSYYNSLFSKIAIFTLFIQPVFSIMMINNTKIKYIFMPIYLFLSVLYLIFNIANKSNIFSEKSKMGHLSWNFFTTSYNSNKKSNIVFSIWLFFLLFSFLYNGSWFLALCGVILLLLSYYMYFTDGTVGSMWCWMVNIIMLFFASYLLIILPFQIK